MSSRQNIQLRFLDNLEIVVTKILEKDKDLMEAKAEDELKRSSPTVFQRLWSWLVYLENSKTKCGRPTLQLLLAERINKLLCSSGWNNKVKLLAGATCRKYYLPIFFLTKLGH